ncbi:sensor histidine kinase [Streptomyces filamentosus]|uniref:histidine kinase n=2 Tax=Streptomyces filamentosus TaxID=67294 RepID=A0ABY4V0X1_STRFL|nr:MULTISPECIES: sensor histidine kinase [Streptomyces]MYR79571.1 sensor histidine kinase [Streptomyces sp. SID5466]EFE75515.1 two-component system sensor kinase [Streptomyces filamentosus NRRL 15998]ESU48079.1 putative two-component system sensor kinase [Streptomyces sp. HCCB10043]EWS92550.1 two-component system sensor kinase [Streptomyces filamentosus NRRL 11379]USC48867.1 sensor histidine kinase [Streptomyces filamentosus]
MQRLYDFIRRHPTGVDVFWAVFLLGLSGMSMVSGMYDAGREELVAVPVALGFSTVVALRRKAPEKMLLLAILVGVVQLVFDVRPGIGNFAMLVITYTVATVGERWASRLALICSLSAAALSQLRWEAEPGGSWAQVVFVTVIMTVPFVLAWVLGDSLRTRRAYFDQLEERAARLEREREAQSKVAVAAERARIARELHDVVAHNVSVMVVQADGAAYVMDAAPDQAKQALETISSTGRQALAEMRRLLGVLRTGDAPESGEYVPQPDVEQIEDLVAQVRQTGLEVDFKVEGTPRPLPSGVELTAYRVVQEALTNTRKHGGPDAGASVRLVYFDDGLGLLIEDDGRGAAHELYEDGGADGAGHGMIGMRERVGMVGGTLDAGPRPGGGFRISALLPLKPPG